MRHASQDTHGFHMDDNELIVDDKRVEAITISATVDARGKGEARADAEVFANEMIRRARVNGTAHCDDADVYNVVRRVANIFRMYPAAGPTTTETITTETIKVEALNEEEEEGAALNEVGSGRRRRRSRRRRRCCSERRRRGNEQTARRRNCQYDVSAKHRRREGSCSQMDSSILATRLSQADVWVENTMKKFDLSQTGTERTRWFGTSGTRANVQTVLNSIEAVFDTGVEMKWRANDLNHKNSEGNPVCSENGDRGTVAYVYPNY